ncbi:hypothetical protein [Pasteurella canis]|uniref:hypothetical protein n=1 Tax=Pasteurella canis TaxID=753 RepID=UPI000D81A655|nr:hypothetical protein [Pasteurella canis]SPY33263.1 Uncharacterised protein [Pasteurella canis]
MTEKRSTPKVVPLDIEVSAETVIDGIEMGVLANGIPYLTQNGLAIACGVQRLRIKEISDEWAESIESGIFKKGKMTFISSYLRERGFDNPKLFIPFIKNGVEYYAFPDVVCMAILEFYAFESSKTDNQVAVRSYRNLARYGLREYIYKSVGYVPDDAWKHYHDRVSLIKNKASVPEGYFIVFNEIAGMMIDLINSGLVVNQYTVPDISVGLAWSAHWRTNNLSQSLGEVKDCSHYYPEAFRQSKSNPQKINAYPDAALPEFRRWFKREYLLTKFPAYILKKATYLPKGNEDATKLIEAFKN